MAKCFQLVLSGLIIALACGCGKSTTESPPPSLTFFQSECRPGSEIDTGTILPPDGPPFPPFDNDTVYFEVSCDTLIVRHDAKWANCGSIIIYDYRKEASLLIFNETDTSSQMLRCMCDFDLTARLAGLANGVYTVQVWDKGNMHGWYGPVDSLIAQGEVEISCP